MVYRFEFAPEMIALANARYEWMAESAPDWAEKWYRGLFEKILTLKSHPNRCPVAAESEEFGEQLRYLTYGKRRDVFRVLFTIRGDMIRVIALHHASQGPLEF